MRHCQPPIGSRGDQLGCPQTVDMSAGGPVVSRFLSTGYAEARRIVISLNPYRTGQYSHNTAY